MGLVSNLAVIGGIACTAIYALTRLLALLIVLRGTRPEQRGDLVRALADLFHPRTRNRRVRRSSNRIRRSDN